MTGREGGKYVNMLHEGRYQYIRISVWWLVICYASEVKGCGRRTPELFNAALRMKQDANSIEQ